MRNSFLLIFLISLSASLYSEDSIVVPLDTLQHPTPDSAALQPLTSNSAALQLPTFNITIHQDSLIRQLIEDKIAGRERQDVDIQGYRVQIYSSNHQQLAKLEAMRLEKDMTDKISLPVYVTYVPPFWKVRIGDFATYEEAQEFKNGFVREFPELLGDTYVVRDQVTVKQ